MNEPILPKAWYGHDVRIYFRDGRDPEWGRLDDANLVGFTYSDHGEVKFRPWSVVDRVVSDE